MKEEAEEKGQVGEKAAGVTKHHTLFCGLLTVADA